MNDQNFFLFIFVYVFVVEFLGGYSIWAAFPLKETGHIVLLVIGIFLCLVGATCAIWGCLVYQKRQRAYTRMLNGEHSQTEQAIEDCHPPESPQ